MAKKEPLLSICIPTYNREKYLKRLLDSIVCQNEFLETDDIEIVVDDGPSTDNTEHTVKEYIKKYGDKIKYYRNPIRIGMCPAFLEALNLGTGKYLWLMGSDDFVDKKSLLCFKKAIKSNPRLILSHRIEYGSFGEILTTKKNLGESITNVTFENFFELLGKNEISYYDRVNYFTFISIFCMEKSLYKESYLYLQSLYDSKLLREHYFNFSLIGFSYLKNGDTISIINSPDIVVCETYNHGWKPNKKISSDLYHLTKYLMGKYPLTLYCRLFFHKMNIIWRFNCNVVPHIKGFLKKMGVFNLILKLYNKHFSKN